MSFPVTAFLKPLASFCDCTALIVSGVVGNAEDRFSRDAAHFIPYVCTYRTWAYENKKGASGSCLIDAMAENQN